jgi:hypothetical protein
VRERELRIVGVLRRGELFRPLAESAQLGQDINLRRLVDPGLRIRDDRVGDPAIGESEVSREYVNPLIGTTRRQ